MPRRVPRSPLLLALAAFTAASCEAKGASGDRVPPADSASWSLSSAPRARIGGGEAKAEYELDRIYGALIEPSGGMVVGNSGTGEVRHYDAAGTYRATTGRQGSGPAEFRGINWMGHYRGDSTLVFDLRAQRFTVLGPNRAVARSFAPGAGGGPARPLGSFSDGSILLAVEKSYDPRRQSGRVRDVVTVYAISPRGEVTGRIGAFPGAEWVLYSTRSSFRSSQLPFGRNGLVAAWGNGIVRGSSESPTLHLLDRAGNERTTVDLRLSGRTLGRSEVSDGIEEAVEDRAERAALEREVRRAGPVQAPMVTDLRVAGDGNLWVRTYPQPGATLTKWLVLEPGGKTVGSVMMAQAWLPLDVQGNQVLIRERDADGIERLSLREVNR